MEFPSNVTRSTQDLTVGGSEKEPTGGGASPSRRGDPDDGQETEERDQRDQPADGLSNAEQAVENQERALQCGDESPGYRWAPARRPLSLSDHNQRRLLSRTT